MAYVNIQDYVGCPRCLNRRECQGKCRMLPLLVYFRARGICECFKYDLEWRKEGEAK